MTTREIVRMPDGTNAARINGHVIHHGMHVDADIAAAADVVGSFDDYREVSRTEAEFYDSSHVVYVGRHQTPFVRKEARPTCEPSDSGAWPL